LKQVEFWRWRYRDIETGRICRTAVACTAEEAQTLYAEAERIEGTMSLREEGSAVSLSPAHHVGVEGHSLGTAEK